MTCVYFLLRSGRVVYIGQTINLRKRLPKHYKKRYDAVRWILCPKELLLHYESRWINRFKPKYNKKPGPLSVLGPTILVRYPVEFIPEIKAMIEEYKKRRTLIAAFYEDDTD